MDVVKLLFYSRKEYATLRNPTNRQLFNMFDLVRLILFGFFFGFPHRVSIINSAVVTPSYSRCKDKEKKTKTFIFVSFFLFYVNFGPFPLYFFSF